MEQTPTSPQNVQWIEETIVVTNNHANIKLHCIICNQHPPDLREIKQSGPNVESLGPLAAILRS